jgi:hypothetical protein
VTLLWLLGPEPMTTTADNAKADEAYGLTAEQIKALDDMVARRMQNTGEALDVARAAIADVLRVMAAEAEARKAAGACACAVCAAPMAPPSTSGEAA